MKQVYLPSIVLSAVLVVLVVGYRIYNKPDNSNLSDVLIHESTPVEESIAARLDTFMDSRNINKIIVFRLLTYDCSECKRYFTDLYTNIRKKTDNVLILSRFSGYRSLDIFKKTINITDSIINVNQMITKYDKFDSYTFMYVKGGIVERLYTPVKNNNTQNEQMMESYLKEVSIPK